MKKIFILLMLVIQLFGNAVSVPIDTIDKDGTGISVKLPNVDIGLSGVVVHKIDDAHSIILKKAEVIAYDKTTQKAILRLTKYEELENKALPISEWKVTTKDSVVLAIGYKRALLIAPTEEIYHKITKNIKLEWINSDYFTVLLSTNGHPTPLIEDFNSMSEKYAVGLVLIYLNDKLYTLDAKSFKILSVSDALFTKEAKKELQLPFYSRVKEIEANWFGAGSDKLKSYTPYYHKLLKKYNENKIK
jgi:hypothetical protein